MLQSSSAQHICSNAANQPDIIDGIFDSVMIEETSMTSPAPEEPVRQQSSEGNNADLLPEEPERQQSSEENSLSLNISTPLGENISAVSKPLPLTE